MPRMKLAVPEESNGKFRVERGRGACRLLALVEVPSAGNGSKPQNENLGISNVTGSRA